MRITSQQEFLKTPAGALAKQELEQMATSQTYKTSAMRDLALEQTLTFVERHINYLVKHPYINPIVYVSNLKIMTKSKRS